MIKLFNPFLQADPHLFKSRSQSADLIHTARLDFMIQFAPGKSICAVSQRNQ
jgi:hypothetical protein